MRLHDLEVFERITIQCHDNPDADALASGYGLYCYFHSKGKKVRLVYSGVNQIQKANLTLMLEKLHLPVEYQLSLPGNPFRAAGLLVTVDCQYGGGNTSLILADATASIDHHPDHSPDLERKIIVPSLGSCATLIWRLLCNENFDVSSYPYLETALYYGLYSDTNQLSEIYHPLDLDMSSSLRYDKPLITLFRNSNISLKELEIAGIAMIRYSYNDDYGFAVIQAKPCDPNILGLISDFLLQVAEIKSCLVYNEIEGSGDFKLSVRSCIPEVSANDLAVFLTKDIGNGGGHLQKAGGYVNRRLYEEKYPTTHSEAFFNNRMVKYFDSYDVLYAGQSDIDLSGMKRYRKRRTLSGYIKVSDCFAPNTPITFHTAEGYMERIVTDDLILVLNDNGIFLPVLSPEFHASYYCEDLPFRTAAGANKPVARNILNNDTVNLLPYAKTCILTQETSIYARPLAKGVKVFTLADPEHYITGEPGDYLAVSPQNHRDISVMPQNTFQDAYEQTP